jgi:hypothetical protein
LDDTDPPHAPRVPLRRLFRNPEFGHELGTKSVEGSVASAASGAVIAASVGWSFFHTTSMIVRDMPATRIRIAPMANVIGDSNNANRPNTTSQTGMIARRLNSIDMVVTLLFWSFADNEERGRPWPSLPSRRTELRSYLDLDLLRHGLRTERQADCQHAGPVLGADFGSVDRRW